MSSENPENVSLFLKSFATMAVLFGLDSTVVSQAQNSVASIITAVGMLISGVTGLYGLYRKIKNGQWSAA